MHFSKMDAYYYLATQGDSEALKTLYKEFLQKAAKLTYNCLKSCSNYSGNPDDFWDFVDKMFFRMLNEYEPEKGQFCTFLEYVVSKRIGSQVSTQLAETASKYTDMSDDFEGKGGIEGIADPNQVPIVSDIAMTNFKYQISSKSRNKTNAERIRDKILLLQYSGYTSNEICEYLNITYGQLRTYLKNIQKDRTIINLKLDLK